MSAEHTKDSTRVAAGLKAALHNPNVSEEAKEHAMQKLKEMGQDTEPVVDSAQHTSGNGDETRVLAGYKATLSNPYTSEKAKLHAEEVLQAAGVIKQTGQSEEEHETRVLAGYKAALHNPRVSEEAKEHAREVLKNSGVEV